MDDTKDIKKSNQLSRFLDEHIIRTNPFGRNISGEKAYKRAERIVAALALLTSHIHENEPVRQSARKIGLRLLSNILDLRDEMRVSNSMKTLAAEAQIRELISSMRILAVSGFVSLQNSEAVIEALDELGSFLTSSQRSALSEHIVLTREDFAVGQSTVQQKHVSIPKAQLTSASETGGADVTDITDGSHLTDTVKDKIVSKYRTGNISNRAQSIMDILNSNGELGIRDISAHLPEYSEKMIQRELATLVQIGKVKKAGLKRWSRYSLV